MRTVAILALNSWQENARGRFFQLALAFGAVVLYVSLLLGVLAADQETRALLDFGLAFIELMALAGALYASSTVFLREMETKTIYLILTRPVGRLEFLLGRFAGILLSVAASMAAMAAIHLSVLLLKGWHWSWAYPAALLCSFLKVAVTAALAVFLALFSSSVLTGLSITLIFWALGHFLPEIRFMSAWGSGFHAAGLLSALSYLIPDLSLLNFRDRLAAAAAGPEASWLLRLGYAAGYSAVWLGLGGLLLRRKEF